MKKWIALLVGLLWYVGMGNARAKYVLEDLNLDDGATWELIGVRLHNYNMVRAQEEWGTFICRDLGALKQMQQTWNLAPMYEDWCDYHYSLKIYRNGRLMKTLRANLKCNYLTIGYMSYKFDESYLRQHARSFKPMNWSDITFTDMFKLRKALKRFEGDATVYLYDDAKPYFEDGYFVVGIDNLHWSANRDSVMRALADELRRLTQSEAYYFQPHVTFMDDKMRFSFRFNVYCSEELYNRYKQARPSMGTVTAHWRSHFAFWHSPEPPSVKITVVGMTQDKYKRLMAD
jgi:hypothetical protein